MTEKRFTIGNVLTKCSGLRDNRKLMTFNEVVDLLNEQHEQIGALRRHIERSTFNKIKVEDVFNCAKYDKFYNNEEAIKSIDWIAKELGVDFG